MTKTIERLLVFALVLAAVVAAGCSGKGQIINDSVPAPALSDNVLGEPSEQPVVVYLPPSYASANTRYPVLYVLPGFNSYVTEFIDGSYQGFNLLEAMDRLVKEGKVGEMIVVVVNGRNVLGGSFYVNSPVTGGWEDFVVSDVVRYVDQNYKTLPYKKSRGITGHSMGGFGALHIAMRHPDVFCAVYALSPGLFGREGLRLSGVLGNNAVVDRMLQRQREWGELGREEAHAAFISFVESLYASGEAERAVDGLRYSYGAAFSPDAEANAPYILYPYDSDDGRRSINMSVWIRWDQGLGDLEGKVAAYRDNLLQLEGVVIDVGLREENQWLLDGCRVFTSELEEAGVPHQLATFEGGHGDRFRERIEQHMLPFFSGILAFE